MVGYGLEKRKGKGRKMNYERSVWDISMFTFGIGVELE